MKKLLFPIAVFATVLSSQAATLASYNFASLTGTRNDWTFNTPVISSTWTGDPRPAGQFYLLNGTTEATVASGVSLGNLAANNSSLIYTVAGIVDGELNLAGFTTGTTAGQANVAGYMTFQLSAAAGSNLTLNSISFTGWRNGSGAPDTVNFDYSLDGGSNWLDYGTAVVRGTTGSASNATDVFSNTLNISSGNSVLFRFAPYITSAGTSTGNWHITGLSMDGSVTAVPEPSVALLGGLGALALLRRRRA